MKMNNNIKGKWLNERTYECFLHSENETETSLKIPSEN